MQIPDHFIALDIPASSFIGHCGDFYVHVDEPILGIRIAPHHMNMAGMAHGGMLAAMADIALAVMIRRAIGEPPVPFVTLSLGLDYIGAARLGDWVQAHVTVDKLGRRVVNAHCRIEAEKRLALRANGVFLMPPDARTGRTD